MPPLLGSEEAGLGSVRTAAGGDTGSAPTPPSGTGLAILGKFSAISGDAAIPTTTYMDDAGSVGGGSASPIQYPTSARQITVLRLVAPVGTGANPPTATLMKNGVATAMTCTLPGGAAAGTEVSDTAHAVSYVDGDTFDVRLTQAISAEGPTPFTATIEGPASGSVGVGTLTAADASIVVAGTAANPTVRANLSAVAPSAVGIGTAGVLLTEARGDHGHATLTLPTSASFAALAVTSMVDGTRCYVISRDRVFRLLTGAGLTVNTWDTFNSATAGRQWVADNSLSLKWAKQATWSIDPANSTGLASDDNTGVDDAHPLRSLSELGCRWRGAPIAIFSAIRLLSDMPSTDNPHFDYSLVGSSAFVTLSGVPTVLFSGTVTAASQATAAPSATDNTISCAGLPVSFTASGGLAKGVMYKRTNSTAIYWGGLAEPVAKTLRISQPIDPLSTGATPFPAVNDTFQALTLPKLAALSFAHTDRTQMYIDLVDDRGAYSDFVVLPVFWTSCYLSTARVELEAGAWLNYIVNAPGYTRWGGPFPGSNIGGAFIGTGATAYLFFQVKENWANRIFLQGCGLHFSANCQVVQNPGDGIYAYGVTTNIVLVDYWSFLLSGAFAGTGNTSKIVNVTRWSQVAHQNGAAGAVGGTSTDANGYSVGGVASVTGTDVPLTAQGNGLYKTQ